MPPNDAKYHHTSSANYRQPAKIVRYGIQHNHTQPIMVNCHTQHVRKRYFGYDYAEFFGMLGVIMLGIVLLSTIMRIIIMLSATLCCLIIMS
jgi:hypothetical protein